MGEVCMNVTPETGQVPSPWHVATSESGGCRPFSGWKGRCASARLAAAAPTLRAGLPVLKIKFGSDAYFSLLTWRAELKPFLALGERLVLVVDDHVLMIGEEGEETLTKEAFEAFLASNPK